MPIFPGWMSTIAVDHHSRASRSVSSALFGAMLARALDALELGAEHLDDRRIVFRGELVVHRLHHGAHALDLGRRDLVHLHALRLQLVERPARGGAAELALVVARLDRRLAQDLLLL